MSSFRDTDGNLEEHGSSRRRIKTLTFSIAPKMTWVEKLLLVLLKHSLEFTQMKNLGALKLGVTLL